MIYAINDTVMALNQFLKDSSGNFTIEVNPDFLIWRNRKQALFNFLNSTLSPLFLLLLLAKNLVEVFGKFWRNGLPQF